MIQQRMGPSINIFLKCSRKHACSRVHPNLERISTIISSRILNPFFTSSNKAFLTSPLPTFLFLYCSSMGANVPLTKLRSNLTPALIPPPPLNDLKPFLNCPVMIPFQDLSEACLPYRMMLCLQCLPEEMEVNSFVFCFQRKETQSKINKIGLFLEDEIRCSKVSVDDVVVMQNPDLASKFPRDFPVVSLFKN